MDKFHLGVVGANGRLGAALIEAACARGLSPRPIVRDDRDQGVIGKRFGASEMYYANPDHEDALVPVFEGLTHVIAAVEARALGPGAAICASEAGAALVNAARRSGVERILVVSVMGAYRWSPHPLCRRAHWFEQSLRNADGPWAVARVSAYVDELVEGHIRPPDGLAAHSFDPSGRYSPLTRAEAADLLLHMVRRIGRHRSQAIGGLDTYSSAQLEALIQKWQPVRQGRSTRYLGLPPGDVSVDSETTLCAVGLSPATRLVEAVDAVYHGRPVPNTTHFEVYPKGQPASDVADTEQDVAVFDNAGVDLRRVVHRQLREHLLEEGVPVARLDFSEAIVRGAEVEAHGGVISELDGVRAYDEGGELIYTGPMCFVHDKLADGLWLFAGERIPQRVWDALDMGVRRRLVQSERWSNDPRVVDWADRLA